MTPLEILKAARSMIVYEDRYLHFTALGAAIALIFGRVSESYIAVGISSLVFGIVAHELDIRRNERRREK